jgi:hypothetical protein
VNAERTVSLTCVAASALWVLMVLFLAAGTVVAATAGPDRGVALAIALVAYGLACSAGAATLTMRNMFAGQNRKMEAAFNLGKEAGAIPFRRQQ